MIDPSAHIRPGARADYALLSRFHYRAGPPATAVHYLAAANPDPKEADAIGVLVVSMPTLNARWRPAAWPGCFNDPDPRIRARAINASLRTISRVIVDPRWRGLGIGAALVRAYLRQPITPATEAPAAMGRYCSIFTAAGMTPWDPPPSPRDVRLAAALRIAGLSPEALLLQPTQPPPVVKRALRTWANASRATRALLAGSAEALARAGAIALLARPIAYTHGRPELTCVSSSPPSPAATAACEGTPCSIPTPSPAPSIPKP